VCLAARAGRTPLPRPRRQRAGELVDADRVRRWWGRDGWPRSAAHSPGHGRGWWPAVAGRRRRPRPRRSRRPAPRPRRRGWSLRRQRRFGGELDVVGDAGGGAAVRVAGPGLRQVQSPVDERVPAGARVGQIHGDHAGGRRSRSVRRCRCTGVVRPPSGRPSSRHRSRRRPGSRAGRRSGRPRIRAGRRGPRRRPTSPAPAGAAARPAWPGRDARRSSSSSCRPVPRPGPASARRRAAAARSGRTAARSGRSPHRTPVATVGGLRCVPRPPPRRLCSTQARHARAVAASLPADTPERSLREPVSNPDNELRLSY
jgi:hypothetical protein